MRYAYIVLFVASILLATNVAADESQKARDAFQSGDYETALVIWQPLAESGDADAQFGLGQMYGNGFGVMMDDALAIKWYGVAAGQGHAKAQFNLAVMHQNGWGTPQSDAEAMKLYALAAEQGVSPAMVALGRFYSMDFLDSFDPVLAYKWLKLAHLFHDTDASIKLDFIESKLSDEQKAEGERLVTGWTEKNASLLASQPN